MSYMRHPVYAWCDDERIHLWARADNEDEVGAFDPVHGGDVESDETHRGAWEFPDFAGGLAMPIAIWDALCLYRVSQLAEDPGGLAAAFEAAVEHTGNFGAFAFERALGGDPDARFAELMADAQKRRAASTEERNDDQ